MEYLKIAGMKFPRIGIGTWQMGGSYNYDMSGKDAHVAAIRDAVRHGCTHIDTAEIYGNGASEEIVGEAIKEFNRQNLIITSKVWHTHLNYSGVIESLNGTLKRLQTGYVDCYLIHRPSPEMDMKGTMKALEELQRQGLARHIGVSNFSVAQVEEVSKYLEDSKIEIVQNEFNILHQDREALEYCQKNKILFVAYRPLAKGTLAAGGIPAVDSFAKKYGKTRAQVCLNWLVSKPNLATIPKASSSAHLKENVESMGWRMSEEDYALLDSVQGARG